MIGATRMMYPLPIDAPEMRFQKQLGGVTGFSFDSGRLILNYSEVESGGALFFSAEAECISRIKKCSRSPAPAV